VIAVAILLTHTANPVVIRMLIKVLHHMTTDTWGRCVKSSVIIKYHFLLNLPYSDLTFPVRISATAEKHTDLYTTFFTQNELRNNILELLNKDLEHSVFGIHYVGNRFSLY
jgi:hypothetical protein